MGVLRRICDPVLVVDSRVMIFEFDYKKKRTTVPDKIMVYLINMASDMSSAEVIAAWGLPVGAADRSCDGVKTTFFNNDAATDADTGVVSVQKSTVRWGYSRDCSRGGRRRLGGILNFVICTPRTNQLIHECFLMVIFSRC